MTSSIGYGQMEACAPSPPGPPHQAGPMQEIHKVRRRRGKSMAQCCQACVVRPSVPPRSHSANVMAAAPTIAFTCRRRHASAVCGADQTLLSCCSSPSLQVSAGVVLRPHHLRWVGVLGRSSRTSVADARDEVSCAPRPRQQALDHCSQEHAAMALQCGSHASTSRAACKQHSMRLSSRVLHAAAPTRPSRGQSVRVLATATGTQQDSGSRTIVQKNTPGEMPFPWSEKDPYRLPVAIERVQQQLMAKGEVWGGGGRTCMEGLHDRRCVLHAWRAGLCRVLHALCQCTAPAPELGHARHGACMPGAHQGAGHCPAPPWPCRPSLAAVQAGRRRGSSRLWTES